MEQYNQFMPKKEKIKILFISAEVAPFAKVGGLGDVAGALPPALRKSGVDIRIMMPLYGNIKKHSLNRSAAVSQRGLRRSLRAAVPCGDCGETATSPNLSFARRGTKTIECGGEKYPLKKIIENLEVEFDGKMESVNVYETALGGSNRSRTPLRSPTPSHGVPVYFIENKKFFGGNKVYDGKDKFLFFSKAAADIVALLTYGECQSSAHGKIPPSRNTAGRPPFIKGGEPVLYPLSSSDCGTLPFMKKGKPWKPDIIHCNDNHTALMPVLLNSMSGNFARRDGASAKGRLPVPLAGTQCSVSTIGKKIKTVLTIHNLEFQGQFSPKDMEKAKLSVKKNETLAKDSKDGDINKMVQGILSADAVTTVSPTYAKEILTKEYGEGLENILKMRKKDLYGILNGIDTEKFNPETDPFIQYNYSTKDLAGKIKCKEELIGEYFGGFSSCVTRGLTPLRGVRPRRSHLPLPPLIGLVSRLTPQKGIDLVIKAIPKLFKTHPETLFILLGTGLPEYEKKLKELESKYPANFRPLISFDIKIAQLIYAASDIFLMPSKFEPCGLGQLIAMRYGAVPVARKTGGLADTVEEYVETRHCRVSKEIQSDKTGQCPVSTTKLHKKNRKSNGFLFKKYSSDAMLKCLDEALRLYRDKKAWKRIMLNGMRRDSSWGRSAKEYIKIYKSILKP